MSANVRLRSLLLCVAVSLVVGCRVAVIVVEGGEVQSIGLDACAEGTICIVEVSDTNFSESFTAVPNAGWHFVRWNNGGNFLCADSTNPTCVISAVGTDGNEGIEAIIASDQTFYIMPIFGPILDTVTVDGREWAQVDQFTNLSWNDINAVCPEGACAGILNGHNMTGWTWASVDDVTGLFNHYIGSDEVSPGPVLFAIHCHDSFEFFNNGWRSMGKGSKEEISGWVTADNPEAMATINELTVEGECFRFFFTGNRNPLAFPPPGGFFWRMK